MGEIYKKEDFNVDVCKLLENDVNDNTDLIAKIESFRMLKDRALEGECWTYVFGILDKFEDALRKRATYANSLKNDISIVNKTISGAIDIVGEGQIDIENKDVYEETANKAKVAYDDAQKNLTPGDPDYDDIKKRYLEATSKLEALMNFIDVTETQYSSINEQCGTVIQEYRGVVNGLPTVNTSKFNFKGQTSNSSNSLSQI